MRTLWLTTARVVRGRGNRKATTTVPGPPSLRVMTRLASPDAPADARVHGLHQRLGLNVPAKWWPTRSGLKAVEAAGFSWVQVHAPAQSVLRSPRDVLRHARALRRELD